MKYSLAMFTAQFGVEAIRHELFHGQQERTLCILDRVDRVDIHELQPAIGARADWHLILCRDPA
jgi:hypothetical protein